MYMAKAGKCIKCDEQVDTRMDTQSGEVFPVCQPASSGNKKVHVGLWWKNKKKLFIEIYAVAMFL